MMIEKIKIVNTVFLVILVSFISISCGKEVVTEDELEGISVTFYEKDKGTTIEIDFADNEIKALEYADETQEMEYTFEKSKEVKEFIMDNILSKKNKSQLKNNDTSKILWHIVIWSKSGNYTYTGLEGIDEFPEYWTDLMELIAL